MQKKLYFLDEQEKNRILYLHESRTQGQYLLNEQIGEIPYPTGVSKKAVDRILNFSKENQKKFSGSLLNRIQIETIDKEFGAGTYQKFVAAGGGKVLKGEKKFSTPKVSFDNYKCVRGYIKDSKNYSGRKYIDQGGNLMSGIFAQVMSGMGVGITYTYYDNGVMFYKDQSNKRIPSEEDTFYKYSCNGNKIELTQELVNIDGKKITTNEKKPSTQAATNYQQVAGGYVSPNLVTPEKIQQIRTTIGSQETSKTLSQTDINNLYATLFNALPKKQ